MSDKKKFRKKKKKKENQCIPGIKFLGKKKAAAKVLLTMVSKLRALNYDCKLVLGVTDHCQAKIFTLNISKKLYVYKNLSQLSETLTLNRHKKPLSQKAGQCQEICLGGGRAKQRLQKLQENG